MTEFSPDLDFSVRCERITEKDKAPFVLPRRVLWGCIFVFALIGIGGVLGGLASIIVPLIMSSAIEPVITGFLLFIGVTGLGMTYSYLQKIMLVLSATRATDKIYVAKLLGINTHFENRLPKTYLDFEVLGRLCYQSYGRTLEGAASFKEISLPAWVEIHVVEVGDYDTVFLRIKKILEAK